MKRVLVADPISPEGLEILGAASGVEVVVRDDIRPDDLLVEIGDYDAIIVRSKTKVTREVIGAAKRLRVIARGGVGLDNIDLAAAEEAGIKVINTPSASSISVAEHVLALCFALARHIPSAHASTAAGKWEKKALKGIELTGRTLGIVGLGRIGRELAARASGIGMMVIGCDPFVGREEAGAFKVELTGLPRVLQDSDFVSLHVPLNLETRGMIGAAELGIMKPSAYLVNCARGGVVDEEALYNALKENKIAGAALDVFESEPPDGSPILGLENVVLTPHIAASTLDGQRRVGIEVAERVLDELGSPEDAAH